MNVKYIYYPYGAQRGMPFNTITAKHFTGQYHETALPGGEGLYFYNARWYDPKLGSFLSADSIVPAPLDPQSLNRYAYAGGNPLRFSDPSGHTKLCGAACEDGYKWSPVTKKSGGGGGSYGSGSGSKYYSTKSAKAVPPPPSRTKQNSISAAWNRLWHHPYIEPLWRHPQIGIPVIYSMYRQIKYGYVPQGLLLTTDWYFELGEPERSYGSGSEITQFLMGDVGVDYARIEYLRYLRGERGPVQGEGRYDYRFDIEAPIELVRTLTQDEWSGSFLGGYQVEMRNLHENEVGSLALVMVHNDTGWASATHIPFTDSTTRPNVDRSQPGPGGTLAQTYWWMEWINK